MWYASEHGFSNNGNSDLNYCLNMNDWVLNKRIFHVYSFYAHASGFRINSVQLVWLKNKSWLLMSACEDGSVKVFDWLRNFELIDTLTGHYGAVNNMIYDGEFLFTTSVDHSVRTWELTAPGSVVGRMTERRSMYENDLLTTKNEVFWRAEGKGPKGKAKAKAKGKAKAK